jgi:hydroxyacylglutathione hydrolase
MILNDQIKIDPVRTLKDNYVWVITDIVHKTAVIIDPGEARPVIDFLKARGLSLMAILVTHHHWDHTDGIAPLLQAYSVPVYGSASGLTPAITNPIQAGSSIQIQSFPLTFQVMEIPGHTLDHIAYYSQGTLFCGDTLFGAGCGRLFEGTAAQLYDSLQKIAALPDDTKIYCAHEYTLHNLQFAQMVEPDNKNITKRIHQVIQLRNHHHPSLPSTLKEEKETNPFLRCENATIRDKVSQYVGQALHTPMAVFAALRKWKDGF